MSGPEAAPGVVEHPEIETGPTAHGELEVDEVRRRAIRGVGTMFVRSLGQRGLQMVGNVLLARWLAPRTIGLYAIVSMIIGLAGMISDLGLSAALVQRKEKLKELDLRTGFTLNMCFNIVAVGAIWVCAPMLAAAFDAPSAVTGIRAMSLTILLSTFTFVPSIQLERELRFGRITLADLVSQITYLSIALTLAFPYWRQPSRAEHNAHGAVWVFIWAMIAAKLVHTVIVNTAYRWRPRFGLEWSALKAMFRFGLPYQLNGWVNALKDNFVPMFVGLVAGPRAVGFIVWAAGLATNALFLLPIVQRVTFPTFARLQHDLPALKDAIEKAIKWVAATVIPSVFFLAALAPYIVDHVYTSKWRIGLPSFYLLCIPMINAAYSTVMVSALYGLGRAKTVLRLTVVWALAGWALGVPLTLMFNQNGFALAMSIVSWLSFMSVREMNKVVKISFIPAMVKIGVLAGVPAVAVAMLAPMVVNGLGSLFVLALFGGLAYLAGLWVTGEIGEFRALIRQARAVPAAAPAAPVAQPAAISGGQDA